MREFCRRVPPPWFLKPRHQAGAIGIRKINGEDELWAVTDALGDERSYFLLEEFVAGDVYHVDSIVYEREVLAAVPSRYGTPPFDVSHSGGVFTTRLLDRETRRGRELLRAQRPTARVARAWCAACRTANTSAAHDGRLVFLETSARVGGAHIAELVEAATGVNMWAEWAKIESGRRQGAVCACPPMRRDYAGLLVSLARQESPDLERVHRSRSGLAAARSRTTPG